MKTKSTLKPAFCSGIILLLQTAVFAISGESGNISGSNTVDGNLTITIPEGITYGMKGIYAGAGAIVNLAEGSEGAVVTVKIPDASNLGGANVHWGIVAENGGNVSLGKVVVDGRNGATTGLRTYGEGSVISVGDYSEIYATKDGVAIESINGGKVIVGDYATLFGTRYGSSTASGVVGASGGDIAIGNFAKITNDGTVEGSSAGETHPAVFASSSSTVTIGSDAEIKSVSTTSGNGAVRAGSGSSNPGTVIIGDRAVITHEADEMGIGLVAQASGSKITVGADSKIITNSERGYGAYASGGAEIEFGANNSITTQGNSATGITATGSGTKISAESGLSIAVNGDSAGAIEAYSGSTVAIKDASLQAGEKSWAIYASSSEALGAATVTGEGVLNITGNIFTRSYGKVDLNFKDGSVFTGRTEQLGNDGTEALDMKLTGTRWNISGDSTLNNLSVGEKSVLKFSVSELDDYIQIAAAVFSMSGESVIEIVFENDFIAKFGDEFQLVSADAYAVGDDIVFDFTLAALAEGLEWDTSDFASSGIIRVIPEPSALAAAFGMMALTLVFFRRRK